MSRLLVIPPLPNILLSIQECMREEYPDIPAIAELVKHDVALYTLLLSAANSPWMGLVKPATSIEHAIMLMGLDRIYTLIQSMAVRTSFSNSDLKQSFWAAAVDVAGVCSDLVKRFSGLDDSKAYSIGMLHNAGIAIMMDQFSDFKGFIRTHEYMSCDKLCVCERKEFSTDHYLQGALMASKWNMGEEVSLAIRCQPIAKKILGGGKIIDENTSTYLSILTLAKHVSAEYRRYWLIEGDDDQLTQDTELALNYMHINHGDFVEIKEDLLENYMNKLPA